MCDETASRADLDDCVGGFCVRKCAFQEQIGVSFGLIYLTVVLRKHFYDFVFYDKIAYAAAVLRTTPIETVFLKCFEC